MLSVPTPPCHTCGSILVRATQDTCLNCTSVATPVRLAYTNHAGLRRIRTFVPRLVFYGSTSWHPDPQWILRAWDVDKQAERDFALAGFAEPATPTCQTCGGAKEIKRTAVRDGGYTFTVPCPTCHGTGRAPVPPTEAPHAL